MEEKERILISACLVGDKCRYDGKSNLSPKIEALLEKYELVPFCPECEGGLKTPRTPSERVGNKVVTKDGRNVTKQYERGAELAWNICFYLKIKVNGYMITQLVVPETCAFSSESEYAEGRGGIGNVVLYRIPSATRYLTHLGFAGIAQKNGTVVAVEGPEADT